MNWLLGGRRFLAFAVAACAVLAVGVVLQLSDQGSSRPPAVTRNPSVVENLPAADHGSVSALTQRPITPAESPEEDGPFDGNYVNVSGGYGFSHPSTWTVRETGTLTELLSADGQVAISFGVGPSGGIELAYEDFVSLIDETYDEASVGVVRADRMRGSLRLKLTGTATTKDDFPIWFTARVIAPRGDQSLATLAAGPLESRGGRTDSANEILDSFEPIDDPR